MKTVFAKESTIRRDWYVVDAANKTLGRLATQLAMRLRGKHKAEYTPHADTGDNLIVINADKNATADNIVTVMKAARAQNLRTVLAVDKEK